MGKIAVVYWSGTGNTEIMANKVAEGAREAGAEVTDYTSETFTADMMEQYEGIAFGCPSMGDEELEDTEFAPMFDSCAAGLSGKRIVLFGSYGWGDGEWMRNWESDCKEKGAILAAESVICNDTPDDEGEESCKALGKALAE